MPRVYAVSVGFALPPQRGAYLFGQCPESIHCSAATRGPREPGWRFHVSARFAGARGPACGVAAAAVMAPAAAAAVASSRRSGRRIYRRLSEGLGAAEAGAAVLEFRDSCLK